MSSCLPRCVDQQFFELEARVLSALLNPDAVNFEDLIELGSKILDNLSTLNSEDLHYFEATWPKQRIHTVSRLRDELFAFRVLAKSMKGSSDQILKEHEVKANFVEILSLMEPSVQKLAKDLRDTQKMVKVKAEELKSSKQEDNSKIHVVESELRQACVHAHSKMKGVFLLTEYMKYRLYRVQEANKSFLVVKDVLERYMAQRHIKYDDKEAFDLEKR